jgi:hypothetical protein
VSIGNQQGTDERYPGFAGFDATLGLMLDFRYAHFIGVELDLFRQNDRGTGNLVIEDTGSICFIPGVAIPYVKQTYELTIGQPAWHVPLLLKLSVPGGDVTVHDPDADREIHKSYASLAFGPEFVFPGQAELRVSPNSLAYPQGAYASSYVMYTGVIGAERRLSDEVDIRLLLSLRGSYHPGAGTSASERGRYAVVDSQIVPLSYKSEWRYQAAFTLGLGWFI